MTRNDDLELAELIANGAVVVDNDATQPRFASAVDQAFLNVERALDLVDGLTGSGVVVCFCGDRLHYDIRGPRQATVWCERPGCVRLMG